MGREPYGMSNGEQRFRDGKFDGARPLSAGALWL